MITRIDPTRSTMLRKQFIVAMNKRFGALKRALYQLIVVEDALGLKPHDHFACNVFDPSKHPRDEEGRWASVTDSPKFKQWFGRSKVKDKAGKPLVVYHGSKGNFEEFEPGQIAGYWFTTDPDYAGEYAKSNDPADWDPTSRRRMPKMTGAHIKPVYLSIEKPANDKQFRKALYQAEDEGYDEHHAESRAVKILIQQGFDGARFNDISGETWVAFIPHQIKSATGNTGEFNPRDPNILNVYDESKHPRDEGGRWTGGNLSGWVTPGGKHIPKIENSHYETLKQHLKLSSQVDFYPNAVAEGYIRLEHSRDFKTLAAEVVAHNLPKFKRWLRDIEYTGEVYVDLMSSSDPMKMVGSKGLEFKWGEEVGRLSANQLITNTRWRNLPADQKLQQFKYWLAGQVTQHILSKEQGDVWLKEYIQKGFDKGMARSYDDVRKPQFAKSMDFYKGSRKEFLASSFFNPVSIDKVKLLLARTFTELEGVTDAMSQGITRNLVDGMVAGNSPRQVAADMAESVDNLGVKRAAAIARTETIRAHAEGQLQALEQLGVEQVGVAVEWSTAADAKVCPKCKPLEGIVLKLDEAQGLIPRHPNCRCAWIPANVGEKDPNQIRTRDRIAAALKASLVGGKRYNWPGKSISKSRPKARI